jgi:hypothetical protein
VAAVAAPVGRGKALGTIFADQEAGIPSCSVFLGWLQRDPDLAEAYHLAGALHAQSWDPRPGRPVKYNEGVAEIICRGIAEGYSHGRGLPVGGDVL